MISRASGKCVIKILSGLHGHGTSASPFANGAPTECRHFTNSPSAPSCSHTASPIRVIMRMFTTTYGESEICTPMCEIGDPTGPIENAITYNVRPFMQPANSPSIFTRSSAGAIQLFVGPASASFSQQMNVRSSTRATSFGSERHK